MFEVRAERFIGFLADIITPAGKQMQLKPMPLREMLELDVFTGRSNI